MINVLVTSLGSNTAIGVIKALRYYPGISITGTDTFPPYLSAGSSFADHFYQVPPAVADDYEMELIRIIKEQQVQCVIPIHDVEVLKIAALAEKYPELCFWAVNKPELIALCNNKKRINTFLGSRQIKVPEMFGSIAEISYPAIYKPNEGVSSKGIRQIISASDTNQQVDLEKGFLQKMVKGEEYTVDCYTSYDVDYFKCCVRKRIETKEGISTKGETVYFSLLEEKAAAIHLMLGYKGASNIQFIVEDGEPYFIEINPRFSGGGILSYHAGFNSPLITVLESVKSPELENFKGQHVKKGVFMTRYWCENFYEG
jgi:carbamoyl-phosphate synthase large subunit